MIIGELKPLNEIAAKVQGYKRILVAGCGGCVTVCQTGGAAQAETLARLLALTLDEPKTTVEWISPTRQCEWEFIEPLREQVQNFDVVLSIACGVGVQAVAELLAGFPVLPGLNTTFMGMPVQPGQFEERCQACGDCILDLTAGICPVARCSKSLLNGPCGGSQNGKCEISPDTPCAWQLIYERLELMGKLENLEKLVLPRDWSRSRDGGPRRMVREDLSLDDEE
ncbi:MAG: hypothetical protein GX964_08175 [Syntrophomonadaceae bacterium]|jgi:ferredoxin|nr:hypothetical protein [Syntrophomonadaceae bacterium]